MTDLTFEDKLNAIVGASILGEAKAEDKAEDDEANIGRLYDRRTRASKDWTQYIKGMKYIEQVRNATKAAGMSGDFRKVVLAVFANTRPGGESVKDQPPSLIEVHQILLGLRKGEESLIDKLEQRLHPSSQNVDQENLPPNVQDAIEILKKEILRNPKHMGLSDLLNPRNVPANTAIVYGDPEVKVKLNNNMGLEELMNIFGRALKETGRVDELMPKFKTGLEARKVVLAHFRPEDSKDQRMQTALLYSFRTTLDELNYLESQEADKEKGTGDRWGVSHPSRLGGTPKESRNRISQIRGRLNAISRGIASPRYVYK